MKTSYDPRDVNIERRKFVRVGIYAITRYFCAIRDKEVGVQTRISDISEGGALLVTLNEGIPVDMPIRMSFVMPGKKDVFVSVEGKVRHTGFLEKDLYRSGVEFMKLKKKEKLAILEFVAAHKR